MAVFHVLGGELVSQGELIDRQADIKGPARTMFRLNNGENVKWGTAAFAEALSLTGGEDLSATPLKAGWEPIGPNKPLTIMIRHVYTGKYPKDGLLGGRKDMAVVSGLKDYAVFAAASRAVNFLKKGVKAQSSFRGPTALEEGTSIVAYQSAVTSDSLTVTLEGAFDNFPKEFVDSIGNALSTAAGIPIFLPWTGYLMTASAVTKLASGLGEALFDGRPAFSFTESLAFNMPGMDLPMAGFRILARNTLDKARFDFDPQRGLIDKTTGAPYAGDEPYVVLSLDGAVRKGLEKFAPTVASASILQKFFNMRDGAQASVEAVVEGLKLLSDSKFRLEADALKAQYEALPAGSTERTKLEERYQALLKNIVSDQMKPKA